MQKAKSLTLEKVLPYILIVGGAVGLFASFVLTYDTLKIAENPNYVPSCSLNPVVSCGSVIDSTEGHMFGLPNPFYGIAAFAVIITIGFAIVAGAKFKRWFWLGLQAGAIAGIAWAYWMFFKSMYSIHALCPYCLSVDVATTTMVWYLTLYNIRVGNISVPKRLQGAYNFARQHHLDILLLWFILMIALILKHFWYYYGKHL
jgi:uncharacterized membrane protein